MADNSTTDPLSEAIGEVCMICALIEAHVGYVLEEEIWAALHGQATDSLVMIIRSMIQNMELRQKTQTAKAVAVGFSEPILPAVEAVMNKIDNELRNERNRYIHDIWMPEGNGYVRIKPGTFVTHEQSRRPVARLGRHEPFTDIDQVRSLITSLREALRELMDLNRQLRALAQKRRIAAGLQPSGEA